MGCPVSQLTLACRNPAQAHMTVFKHAPRYLRGRRNPAQAYMTVFKHALRYLKGRPDLPIICNREQFRRGKFRMNGYTDASFASNPNSRKSTTGSIVLSGGPIRFGAKTQSLTAQSTYCMLERKQSAARPSTAPQGRARPSTAPHGAVLRCAPEL